MATENRNLHKAKKDEFYTQLADIEKECSHYREHSEVQNKKGIIPYILDGDEHHLGLRAFPEDIKLAVWEKQGHRCANKDCPHGPDKEWTLEEVEADHIRPWKDGGKIVEENCQILCRDCNRRKSSK